MMSSQPEFRRHASAPQPSVPATPVSETRPEPPVDAAANDDTVESPFAIFGDPLWGMAIASGILFAVFAALMALG